MSPSTLITLHGGTLLGLPKMEELINVLIVSSNDEFKSI